MYQQQALPQFPIDRPAANPVNLNTGQLPVLPQINFNPQFQQHYPMVVGSLIAIIQGRYNTNVLRMYLFNQMAQNNYNNQNFFNLCEFTMKVLEIKVLKNEIVNLQEGINAVCELCTEQLAAFNMVNDPALQQYVDQNTIAACQQILMNYQTLMAEIQHFAQQAQMQPGFGMQRPMQPQFQGGFRSPQQNNFMQQNAGPITHPHQRNFNAVQGHSNSRWNSGVNTQNQPSGLISNGNQVPVQTVNPTAAKYDKYIKPFTPPAPVQAPQMPKTDLFHSSNIKAVTTVVNNERKESIKWKLSERYPVTIAYDHNVSRITYVEEGDVIKPIITPKEKSMNKGEHFKVPSFQQPGLILPTVEESQATIEQIKESLKEPAITVHETSTIVGDISYEDAIFKSDVELRNLRLKNKKANAYMYLGVLYTPMVSAVNTELLTGYFNRDAYKLNLKDVNNLIFKEVLEKRENRPYYGDDISLNFLNKRLTDTVNHFLKMRLGVTARIESFKDDIVDLHSYIAEKNGITFIESFVANFEYMFEGALTLVSKDTAEYLSKEFLDEIKQEPKPDVLFFQNHYTLTNLDLYSNELCFEIPTNDSAVGIMSDATPFLYEIVDTIFKLAKDNELEKHYRHYIRTKDGVMFEVARGALNEDFYHIAVWKK